MSTKKPAARTSRSSRTKADLEQELEDLKAQLSGEEALTPEAVTVAHARSEEVRETVKGLSVDNIASKGAAFTIEVNRTIQSLTEQCMKKADELKALTEARQLEEEELQKLYNLDVAAASVKSLIQEHEEKKAALDLEIAKARTAWKEEADAHAKSIQQRNAELLADRRREQEEFTYKTKQERLKAEDDFQQSATKRLRELDDRIDLTNKDINERAIAIAKQEGDIATMKARFDGLDAEIDEKVKKAESVMRNVTASQLNNQHALEKKDLEARLGLEMQKNASLEVAANKMAEQVAVLTKQLEAAKQQVTDITVKALESASGSVALQNVRELVKEGAAGGNGGQRKS